jgi:hypothetical protein
MKFSELKRDDWMQLAPYMDTCLLPVTGLTGEEAPWEATDKLGQLQDALDLIERPYRGRVVTYPALHYTGGDTERLAATLHHTCAMLKQKAGFRHVLVVLGPTADAPECAEADAIFRAGADPDALKSEITSTLQKLWRK